MRLSIGSVLRIDDGLWRAKLAPSELQFLGGASLRIGPRSVLLLGEPATFDAKERTLSFDPAAARLLNAGHTEEALIVESSRREETTTPTSAPLGSRAGDARFLSQLPSNLRDLGTRLLTAVRSRFPGDLRYYERSGKYVE